MWNSIFGLSLLFCNYIFSYKVSINYKLIDNKVLNFIFFNIIFYIILTPILFLLVFIKVEIVIIKCFVYLILIFQFLYFIYGKKNYLKNFNYFNKFDYFIIILLILFTFPQITDADSLDYHLGGVIEIMRNETLLLRNDEWYHFRLIGLGEMINFYGLLFYSKNFGQIFQILGFTNILLILKLICKNNKITYLILFSFPLFTSILLSGKQILLMTNCYLIASTILILRLQFSKKLIILILILIITPIGFKHSYVIYSFPMWVYFLFRFRDKVSYVDYIKYSLIIFALIPSIFFIKNIFYYQDPLSPFFEFLKINPDISIINFANELRYSEKVFQIWEFPFVPFLHILPLNIGQISLLLSPLILVFYIIFFYKKTRQLSILILIIYILLFFSGKSLSRYFFDLYLISILIFFSNVNLNKLKRYKEFFILPTVPYSILTIASIVYSIFTITLSTFDTLKFKKSMNKVAHNYEIVTWVNSKIKSNERVLYDKLIRSKTFQNHDFVYYDLSTKSLTNLESIVKNNNIDKIITSSQFFNDKIKNYYSCKINSQKNLNHATRNPLNVQKNIAIIYILDTKCFKW
jgi:hypothetical protein